MADREDDLDEFEEEDDALIDGEADVVCPYCGETVTIEVDPLGGNRQEYVQDCEVCCRPWLVRVETTADGTVSVDLTPSDDPDATD